MVEVGNLPSPFVLDTLWLIIYGLVAKKNAEFMQQISYQVVRKEIFCIGVLDIK